MAAKTGPISGAIVLAISTLARALLCSRVSTYVYTVNSWVCAGRDFHFRRRPLLKDEPLILSAPVCLPFACLASLFLSFSFCRVVVVVAMKCLNQFVKRGHRCNLLCLMHEPQRKNVIFWQRARHLCEATRQTESGRYLLGRSVSAHRHLRN